VVFEITTIFLYLYLTRFKTEDEAVAIANMTSSGLAGTTDHHSVVLHGVS